MLAFDAVQPWRWRGVGASPTTNLLLHSRVCLSAVVMERSSVHVQMPPTSVRLSKRVTWNPASRSSFRAAIPLSPKEGRESAPPAPHHSGRATWGRGQPTSTDYSNLGSGRIHVAVTSLSCLSSGCSSRRRAKARYNCVIMRKVGVRRSIFIEATEQRPKHDSSGICQASELKSYVVD